MRTDLEVLQVEVSVMIQFLIDILPAHWLLDYVKVIRDLRLGNRILEYFMSIHP